MAEERMAGVEGLYKLLESAAPDVLREILTEAVTKLMALEVDALCRKEDSRNKRALRESLPEGRYQTSTSPRGTFRMPHASGRRNSSTVNIVGVHFMHLIVQGRAVISQTEADASWNINAFVSGITFQ